MSCDAPISSAVLADYWLAALEQPEEQAVEEHLFGCDECGERLREIVALAGAVRDLARQGSLMMVVSDAFVERAAAEGLRMREYGVTPGASVACTVTAEDELLIARLAADLSAAKRLDLSFCDHGGIERFRLPDIPFRRAGAGVTFQHSITYAKAAPSETLIARLIAYDDTGREHLIGEYTFNHTRSIPGPAAW